MRKKGKNTLTGDALLSLKEVGLLIAQARILRKMSVVELAERAGVDRRTISQLEAGHPGVSWGVFFQTLSLLNLLRGIEEVLRPENDIEMAASLIRQARSRKKSKRRIKDDEVNF